MFDQLTSTDLPNQLYAELVQAREQERLARRIARQRRAARAAARIRSRRPASLLQRPRGQAAGDVLL
ncbi:hypothetical protein [Microlunatus speluncae]|uniref:hypothetical protein n=1 Tax=Microlunatus speluncae TaxID=2594267 RepID=UPI0012665FA2|nr:hypothetical protein [Microlunatus speluncae]